MAKTKDIKRRVGNTPTPAGVVPESALPFGRESEPWEPGSRPGGGALGSKPTGKGPRIGNTVHTDTGNNDAAPQRHTTSGGKVEKTSKDREPVRKNGQLN